jgi:hypothetical protein
VKASNFSLGRTAPRPPSRRASADTLAGLAPDHTLAGWLADAPGWLDHPPGWLAPPPHPGWLAGLRSPPFVLLVRRFVYFYLSLSLIPPVAPEG